MKQYPYDSEYQRAMLSIMTHYYSRLCREYGGELENVPCPTIRRETNLFRVACDTLDRFITQMVIKLAPIDNSDDYNPQQPPAPLSTQYIATKFVEWYSRTIKTNHGMRLDTIITQIENDSRLTELLKRDKCGVWFLNGYRVREWLTDPLAHGETFIVDIDKLKQEQIDEHVRLGYSGESLTEAIETLDISLDISDKNTRQQDPILQMCKTAPTHVQTRDGGHLLDARSGRGVDNVTSVNVKISNEEFEKFTKMI
jgi:hypothetical protein